MYLLGRLDMLSKDVKKSKGVWGRQFLEYNSNILAINTTTINS